MRVFNLETKVDSLSMTGLIKSRGSKTEPELRKRLKIPRHHKLFSKI